MEARTAVDLFTSAIFLGTTFAAAKFATAASRHKIMLYVITILSANVR